MKQKSLFSEVEIGALKLPNRVVMAPMTRMQCPQDIPDQRVANYYARYARGGVGLIISECTYVNHPVAKGYPNVPAFYGEDAMYGWKKVVEAVHAEGGLIIPQIWHAGDKRAELDQQLSIGPSDVWQDGVQTVKGMSQSDIDDVINAFADAALDAKACGFDGIEVHGAHSFLIDNFLWEERNQRNDKYGGSLENRLRFACEIVRQIRQRVGPDFPIVFRFSQWKQEDYGARIVETVEQLQQLLSALSEAGVDIFHPSTRRFWEPAFAESPLSLAAWTKQLSGKPVIAVGSIGIDQQMDLSVFNGEQQLTTPESLEKVEESIAQGEFDLAAVGRALLGDPDWCQKMAANELSKVKSFNHQSLEQFAQ